MAKSRKVQMSADSKKYQDLVSFLRQNHGLIAPTHEIRAQSRTRKLAKEALRVLYIDAVNSGGGNNLNLTGDSCKAFFNFIEKLPPTKTVDLGAFFSVFEAGILNFDDFFKFIWQTDKLKNIRQKKAALLVRDIHSLQTAENGKFKIFENYTIDPMHLQIPVDIVIVTILNKVFDTELRASHDFELINEFARRSLQREFMLIEDLWFWGFFTTEQLKGEREVKKGINEDKYYSYDAIYPNEAFREKLEEFNELVMR